MNQFDQVDPNRPNVVQFDFDSGDPANSVMGDFGLGDSEAMIAHGDSGGPALVGNQIAAIATWVTPPGSPPDINDYIDGNGDRWWDSSFGEIVGETMVAPYVNNFITPSLKGSYNLVLDMNNQVLGLDGVNENITITAKRNGPNLEL
jgi:hypothetical protein